VQIAEARIEKSIAYRARPFSLHNVSRFDLAPGSSGIDERISGIAAEESVLLVKPPNKVKMIVFGELIIAA
jgi:hypothetical protein